MLEPEKVTIPIAENGIRTVTLPLIDAGLGDGHASFNEGFPFENFQPKTSGGIPPWGEDMNAMLYSSSSICKFYSSGGLFEYDSSHQVAVGGYPLGAIIRHADGGGIDISLTDNNLSSPYAYINDWAEISPDNYCRATGTTTSYEGVFNPPLEAIRDGTEVTINTELVGSNTIGSPLFTTNNMTDAITTSSGVLDIGALPRVAVLRYANSISKWVLINPIPPAATAPPTPTPPAIQTPVGSVVMWFADSIPAGWFECNGASYSTAAYADLWLAIGAIYGANLPDMRGEFPRGFDAGAGVDAGRSLGSNQQGSSTRSNGFDWQSAGSGYKLPFVLHVNTDPVQYSLPDGEAVWFNPPASLNNTTFVQAIQGFTANYNMRAARPRNVAAKFIIKWDASV